MQQKRKRHVQKQPWHAQAGALAPVLVPGLALALAAMKPTTALLLPRFSCALSL